MPSHSKHVSEIIHTKEELLVDKIPTEGVDVFQARCTICPWRGPRRTARHEVVDDANNHNLYPLEVQ